MFQILLVFTNFILFAAAQRLIDCNFNKSISLNSGEWFRYESVDFPKSLALGPSSCKFFVNMSSTTQLWITPVNAYLGYFGIDDWNPLTKAFIDIDTNTKIQTYLTKGLFETMSLFAVTKVDPLEWYAFQTVGITVDSLFGCPFNDMQITLNDSKTIIPIASTYYSLNSNETKYFPRTDCTWNFQTTEDFKFKLVYRYSEFSLNETMFAQINDGDPIDITYNYNIGESDAQYFDGTNLTLQYSAPQRKPKYYFYAVITVVKKASIINNNCNNTTYDLINGYSNFESCSTTYKQSNMTQTRIKVDFAAETCCDKLIIESGNATFALKPNMILNINPKFESYNINFTTDGSIVQGGYKITSVSFSCRNVSENIVIPCNGTSTIVGYENGYCSNVHAKYTLTMEKFCTNALDWEFDFYLRENSDDKILYYINNVTQGTLRYSGMIASGTSGVKSFGIEFISGSNNDSNFEIGKWSWKFRGYSKPSFPNINYQLNANNPAFYFNLERLRSGQEVTVTVEPQFELEMFVTNKYLNNLTNFLLFESLDHTNYIGLLSDASLFIFNSSTFLATKYKTQSKVLTIQQNFDSNTVSDAALYFRIVPTLPADCTNNNIYHVPEDYGNLTFPVSASETCLYSIITYGYVSRSLGIEALFTNSSDINQVTSGSFNQTLPYFNFSDSTANNYQSLRLHGSVFNFIIPKNTQTIISCGRRYNGGAYNTTQIISFPNEINLITSPNYGDTYSYNMGQTFLTTVNSSFTESSFLVSVINQNVSPSANLYIQGYGINNIDLKSQSSPFWTNSSSFTIFYHDPLFSRFLINYQLVESQGGPTTPIPKSTTPRNNASKTFTVITLFIFMAVNLNLFFN